MRFFLVQRPLTSLPFYVIITATNLSLFCKCFEFPQGNSAHLQDRLFYCLPDYTLLGGKFMGFYNDPTASQALGNINREFSKHVKIAKKLRYLYEKGMLSTEELEKAHSQFRGIYRHVLDNVLEE